jgi:hypothetical protein
MTKPLPFAVLALTACIASRQDARSDLPSSQGGKRLHAFDIDDCYFYLVDPRAQACFLTYNCNDRTTMASIDCGKLAAGVPETASAITWAPAPAAP